MASSAFDAADYVPSSSTHYTPQQLGDDDDIFGEEAANLSRTLPATLPWTSGQRTPRPRRLAACAAGGRPSGSRPAAPGASCGGLGIRRRPPGGRSACPGCRRARRRPRRSLRGRRRPLAWPLGWARHRRPSPWGPTRRFGRVEPYPPGPALVPAPWEYPRPPPPTSWAPRWPGGRPFSLQPASPAPGGSVVGIHRSSPSFVHDRRRLACGRAASSHAVRGQLTFVPAHELLCSVCFP